MEYRLKHKMKLPRSDYYQGVLQLRDISEEMLVFVHSQIKKRNDVAVTRTVKLPNGQDLYITSQHFIKLIGKKLKDGFGGQLKVSSKLHTRNKQGKDLYRVNVLYRPSKHKRGDIVTVRGDQVKLLRVGKRIFAMDMKTRKKVLIRISDLME